MIIKGELSHTIMLKKIGVHGGVFIPIQPLILKVSGRKMVMVGVGLKDQVTVKTGTGIPIGTVNLLYHLWVERVRKKLLRVEEY